MQNEIKKVFKSSGCSDILAEYLARDMVNIIAISETTASPEEKAAATEYAIGCMIRKVEMEDAEAADYVRRLVRIEGGVRL